MILSAKTPRWKRMLGHKPEHRVEVSGVVQYQPLSTAPAPIINIYLQQKDRWRIEETHTQFCLN